MDDYIRTYFNYDYLTGKITRSDRRNSLGSIDHYGYLILKIKGIQYKAHRLAWFLYYGEWPINGIDHINGDKYDNRIKNLRCVSQQINVENTKRKPNKHTSCIGIGLDTTTKGLKKQFYTKYRKKTYRFYTLEEAKQFRLQHNLEV